jgi:serine/threonine protein kinase
MSTGPTTPSSPQGVPQEAPTTEPSQPEVQSSAPLTLLPGATVGPWLILERLDWGTFGVVFRARRAEHPDSPPVALKMAKQPWDTRFERESEALRDSDHPSIPHYEGRGVWRASARREYPYFTMEVVEGHRLYDWGQVQSRTHREVLQVVAHLAGALASAHARGVVHRDVKGDNIRVTRAGRAVLLDWGSCWMADGRQLTDTPAPPGTSAYRPPEQRGFMHTFRMDEQARWKSRPSDDMYALGVTLYRLVTGTYLPPCTDGDGLVEREVPRPSDKATVSPALEAIILRLVCDEREARGTAEHLVREALALLQAGGPGLEQRIVPTPSALPTERGQGPSSSEPKEEEEDLSDSAPARRARPSSVSSSREKRQSPEAVPAWLTWTGASALGAGLMALLVLILVRPALPPEEQHKPWLATPEEIAQFAPDAGVADEAQSSVQDVPRAVMPLVLRIGAPMPKKPLEGQKKPPCGPGQIAVNDACWAGPIKGQAAPCRQGMYDYEGECYFAIFDAPRRPTSEQP